MLLWVVTWVDRLIPAVMPQFLSDFAMSCRRHHVVRYSVIPAVGIDYPCLFSLRFDYDILFEMAHYLAHFHAYTD